MFSPIQQIKRAIREAVDTWKDKTWSDFYGIPYDDMYEFLSDEYITIKQSEYDHLLRCKEELAELLRNANRRRKSAERTVRKMRGTIRRINDDAMKSISSRQRTIEEQWEVMRELQRRGLVSTEDLEAVLKDVMHVVRMRFNTTENKH